MKTKVFIIVILIFLFGDTANATKNFIPNGGFEIHTVPDVPDAWDQFLGPKRIVNWYDCWKLDPTIKYAGKYSLRIRNTESGYIGKIFAKSFLNAKYFKRINEQAFTENETYTLSLYLKGDKDGLRVKLKLFNTNKHMKITKNWRRYTITAPFQGKYNIYIILNDIGNLWVDNVQLEEGDTASPYTNSIFGTDFFTLPEPQTRSAIQEEINKFASISKKDSSKTDDFIHTNGQVAIDTSRRQLIVNNSPFFYFGACFMVAHETKERWNSLLDLLKNWGYTVVIANFSARWSDSHATTDEITTFLNLAEEKGLKVIIWISPCAKKEQNGDFIEVRSLPVTEVFKEYKKEIGTLIPRFKTHPALLAWYIIDEPWRMTWVKFRLSHKLIQYARALDDQHPVFVNYAHPYKHYKYQGIVPGDIISQTQYPVPIKPLTVVAKNAAFNSLMGYGKKPVIFWFQLWGGNGRYPTPQELRCMIYLSIINGATGFQTWPMMPGSKMLWDYTKTIISEVKQIEPFLYINKREHLEINKSDFVFATAKIVGDNLYIVAINSSNKKQSVTFKTSTYIKSANVLFENRKIESYNGIFNDVFQPYDRHIYVFDIQGPTKIKQRCTSHKPPINLKQR